MIHSLLPARDCETTTTSSSHPFPYPEPTNHDHGALQEDTTAHQELQLNHDGRFVPTNLLKPIKEETELGSCRNPKPDHMMMMISPNQFKDDPSCRNPAKACVDCNTTKTPLWRSGPQGPKSLCNACGIRYRKARRALAALADPSKFQASHCPKPKRPKLQQHLDPTFVSKKRTKIGYSHCGSKKKGSHHRSHQLCFHVENPHMGSDHYFPKDEEEAAVLLMALSCGLVHG